MKNIFCGRSFLLLRDENRGISRTVDQDQMQKNESALLAPNDSIDTQLTPSRVETSILLILSILQFSLRVRT